MESTTEILISAVIAVYNNEDYAHDLYRSLEAQKLDPRHFEIILVNDGSTDNTGTLAIEWQRSSRLNVRVINKENGGVASARNSGIKLARGKWLAFVDSDDILHKSYMSALAEFTRRDASDSASMLTTRSIIYNERDGVTVDNHPLSWKYKRGDRLVSLGMEPHVVHLAGHSSVVRRSVVVEHEIMFSENVRPGFEDAHFNGRYLSHFPEPVIGLVASARYFYRKRANGTSLIDTTWTRPEKFTHEPRNGHLELLTEVTRRLGYTPIWAQNTVLYAQYWYFSAARSWNSPFSSVDQVLLNDYWDTMHEVFNLIDAETIRKFSLRNFGWYMSEGILRHFKDESWKSSDQYTVYRWGEADRRRKIRKYVYSYSQDMPREQFYVNGREIEAAYAKSIKHDVFGHHLMYERIVHLPTTGSISICLDGHKVPISNLPSMNRLPAFRSSVPRHLELVEGEEVASPQQLAANFYRSGDNVAKRAISGCLAFYAKAAEEAWVNDRSVMASAWKIVSRVATRKIGKIAVSRARRRDLRHAETLVSSALGQSYKDCWILVDRPDRADDNAEHLYRFIRENHPAINAWFLLSPKSADWERLQGEGFRLIPFGSDQSIAATQNAKYILSSHADGGSYAPIDEKRYGQVKAKRIFLQHGMTKDDLSKWLNTKALALMVTCSGPEQESIVEDGSPYRLTRREVKLTGFPRHDSLVRLAIKQQPKDRNVVLIVPTWRKELTEKLKSAISIQDKRELLIGSEFFIEWQKVTNSTVFVEAVRLMGLRTVFALHDHLAAFEDLFKFNDSVEVRPFSQMSVQKMVVSSRLVVTDYSSMSTEAAIAGAAVIHYQFDADRIFDGSHSYSKGWMDYKSDAFGPVCETLDDFEFELTRLAGDNWRRDRVYEDRLSRLLPVLDGTASSRVVEEVLAIDADALRVK